MIRLPAGYRLVFYDTVGSTSEAARELARGGAVGSVVWALQQTAGRGRRGRTWLSPPGNLYVSFVLQPDISAARAAQLGFVAALAVGDTLAGVIAAGPPPAFKWPNDVMVGDCKIAGILVEAEAGEDGSLSTLVVGIGINLASAPAASATPATSVAALGRPAPTPDIMLEALAAHFDIWLRRWRSAGFAPVRSAWRSRAYALGRPIRVRLDPAELRGRFRDIDAEGGLLLETADGVRHISAGDVFPALR